MALQDRIVLGFPVDHWFFLMLNDANYSSEDSMLAGRDDWRRVRVPFAAVAGRRGSPRTTRGPAAPSNSRNFAAIAAISYANSRAKLSRQARSSARVF
jgi:hypothetical protein